MASLSNINGIFDVHSTGAILFSTSHGTSGQILKSNGNAAPTWIPQSDIVGAYLPLSGGTLTGATATATGISFTVGGTLTGTTATFAGNVGIGTNSPTANYPLTLRSKLGDYTKILDWGTDVGGSWGTMQISISAPYATELRSGAWNFAQGNIGIGVTSPNAKLTITGSGNPVGIGDEYGYTGIKFYGAQNGQLEIFNTRGNTSFGNIIFKAGSSESMRIQHGGNVGIGTTSPTLGKLQVAGSGYFG